MRQFKLRDLKQDVAGFTIVELLVALTVFAVLAAAVTPVFKQGNQYWQVTQSRTELRQSLNSALKLMAQELRQADPASIETSQTSALPEAIDGSEQIVSYSIASDPKLRGFALTKGKPKYLEFIRNGKPVSITPASAIDIIDATVDYQVQLMVYQITIQGRYRFPNDVNDDNRLLTVQTVVAPRAEGKVVE